MSENDWFANINGREYGPVNIREIKQWIYDGRVTPETMVWNSSMKDWLPAAQTREFSTLFMHRTPGVGTMIHIQPQSGNCLKVL